MKAPNYITSYVEDNGIGRKIAQQKRGSTHESKALEITQQRLTNLEKEENQPAYYRIIDLTEDGSKYQMKKKLYLNIEVFLLVMNI